MPGTLYPPITRAALSMEMEKRPFSHTSLRKRVVPLSCHLACPSLGNSPWRSDSPDSPLTPASRPMPGLLGAPEPIPGVGGGDNIDSRQGLGFRGLGRGGGWATEISLQLGNPQILLPKLFCCCPQGREAVTWLAWSQEAGMGAENHSTLSTPKGA